MSSKYWEKYQEKRLKSERSCKTPTHTSDKQAYISSLEHQLERTSSSSLLLQTFAERIDQLQRHLNTTDEKVANLSRLIKLQSSESSSCLLSSLEKLEDRVSSIEIRQKSKQDSFKSFSSDVDSALKATEDKIVKLIEEFEDRGKKASGNFSFGGDLAESIAKEREKMVKEAADNAWIAQQTCNKLAEDALMRIAGCEKRIKDFKIEIHDLQPDLQEVEEKVLEKLDSSIENLAGIMKNFARNQENLSNELKDLKEKYFESKDPGVFSFGATFPSVMESMASQAKVKSESNSRDQSKEPEYRSTRKRSSSPKEKKNEKGGKKEENKVKKKVERKNRIEKLYQHFSEKNS